MKIKEDFVLRRVTDTWVVLPIGEATLNFNGMLTLNETGVFLWKLLEEGSTLDGLVSALAQEYGVPPETARADTELFLQGLAEAGCIDMQ